MLIPSHVAELHRSGLSDETIARSGCYSVTGPGSRDLLGWAAGPGLAFPYPGTNGTGAPYTRVKLDIAPPNGKRYRAPKGQPNHLYIPATFDPTWRTDPRVALWVTEGEKKCLKAVQEGLPCVAVPGVWSWKTKGPRETTVPIPDLDALTWPARRVYLIFDSDGVTNLSVRLAEFALAHELRRRGADVRAVHLPPVGPTKVGLDDYLLTHSVDTLCALPVVPIADPAGDPGNSTLTRQGDEFRVAWPLHRVGLMVSMVREHSEGVSAEVAITVGETEIHWSKLNLASPVSREQLSKKLTTGHPRIPWRALLDAACRLCVTESRQGSPVVAVVGRRRTGASHLLDPWVPLHETTVWAGDGGAGKSYLALLAALALSSGAPIPGVTVAQTGPVLYLDWESTQAELEDRLDRLARGLGVTVRDLHYKAMVAPLATDLGAVKAAVSRLGAVCVVVDSLAPASGPEPEGADAAVRTLTALRSLGSTRLVLAHISKATAESGAPARPFGSVFIQNLARSVWEVRRSEEDDGADLTLGLYHRKVNSGRRQPPQSLRLTFAGDRVTVAAAPLGDRADLAQRTPLPDQIQAALRQHGPQTIAGLADLVGAPEDSLLKACNRTVRAGRLRRSEGKPAVWSVPG